MALVAWPNSGRTWARSSARLSRCCRAWAYESVRGADSKRRQRSWRIAIERLLDGIVEFIEEFAVRIGHAIHAREDRLLIASIVNPTNKHRAVRDNDAALSRAWRMRGSLSICAMARPLGSPAAPPHCATIVSGFVWIVHASRAVAEKHHERREAADETDVAK